MIFTNFSLETLAYQRLSVFSIVLMLNLRMTVDSVIHLVLKRQEKGLNLIAYFDSLELSWFWLWGQFIFLSDLFLQCWASKLEARSFAFEEVINTLSSQSDLSGAYQISLCTQDKRTCLDLWLLSLPHREQNEVFIETFSSFIKSSQVSE